MLGRKIDKPERIKYHGLNKLNKDGGYKGTCSACKEPTIFRVVQFKYKDTNFTNRLACVICKTNEPFYKNIPIEKHGLILKRPLTFLEKVKVIVRQKLRKLKRRFKR